MSEDIDDKLLAQQDQDLHSEYEASTNSHAHNDENTEEHNTIIGGEVRKELEVKGSTTAISVSQALRLHEGEAKVQGMIMSRSKPYKMVSATLIGCNNCDYSNEITYEIPLPLPPKKQEIKRCPNCSQTTLCYTHRYVNSVTIEMQDIDKFSEIERLPVILFEEDTTDIGMGERVSVNGQIQIIQHRNGSKLLTYLFAKSIKYQQREELELTPLDIKTIERFAKIPTVIEKLVSMVAPSVIGYRHVKVALLLCAVNTGYDDDNTSIRSRNRIHSLLIGPPGLAKTKLLLAVSKLVPNSRYESGQNSSGKSLTAIVEKEDETHFLRLGPVTLAKGALCAINEIGRMSYEDQGHLLDVMEEGEYTINKYGISGRIKAPTTIIASANPISLSASWINHDKIDINEIPAIKPIVDRFDLVLVFRKLKDQDEIRKYAYQKSELDERKIPDYNMYLRKYLLLAKTIKPILNPEAKSMLNEYYIKLATDGYGSPRLQETLFRLAKARARLKLKKIADEEDAKETMQFYNTIILQCKHVVTIPENPKEMTYDECVSIIKGSEVAIYYEELLKQACNKNLQVKSYIGMDLKLRNSWKARGVLKMLLNHGSIKQVEEKPIVLQWLENRGED